MATFTVSNLNDSGPGSLRAAIRAANHDASGTPTKIDFAVQGTITLTKALPAIINAVTIDATTAPSYAGSGTPVVEINFNGNSGLMFNAGSAGSQLLGVAVDNANGNGVTLNAGSITLNDNYIGLNLAGQAFGNSGDGVYVAPTSSNNQIGVNPTSHGGTTAAAGVVANVISGNGGSGIHLNGSSGNTIEANRIGTNAAGTAAIANHGNGIWLTGGSNNNTIGGTAYINAATGVANNPTGSKGTPALQTFVTPPLGNLVSGNGQSGILIDGNSQNNQLSGNFVGTNAVGTGAIGNGGDGVWIDGADNNSLLGTPFLNPPGSPNAGTYNETPFTYYNVISGNDGNGLHITNSNNTSIQANYIGISAHDDSALGNQLNGILVDGGSQNTELGGPIPLGNVVSGNGVNGIEVTGTAGGFVSENTFGGLTAFYGPAPNGNDGLLINATGGGDLIRTNIFSANGNNGIEIGGNASGVTVDPNVVGLSNSGDAAPNGNDGLLIDGSAHDNSIGGYLIGVAINQVFSANDAYGIAITDQAYDNTVFNNGIGTNFEETGAIGNGEGGVFIGGGANNNVIGGTSTDPSQATANIIIGNNGPGVTLASGLNDNEVVGNLIGVDRLGLPVPNSGPPIVIDGPTSPPPDDDTINVFNGYQTVTGSASNDSIGVFGNYDTVNGGAGADTISIYGQGESISGGAGYDSIGVFGNYNTVNGGAGADTVNVLGQGNAFTGGSGNDTVTVYGNYDTVTGGAGADSITAYGEGESIAGGRSDTNSITAIGGYDTISAGAGIDAAALAAGLSLPGDVPSALAQLLSGLEGLITDSLVNVVNATGNGFTIISGGLPPGDAVINAPLINLSGGYDTLVDGGNEFHDTVTGFSAAQGDTIHLTGGDTVSYALAHSQQVNSGADALIALNDGSTILLKGITHITAGLFS